MENTYTHKKTPDFINKQMDKGSLKKLLGQMYLEYGGAKAASLAEAFGLQICNCFWYYNFNC